MGSYITKEALVYTAFTVDALNTCVTFPLFVFKGPKWVLESMRNTKEDDVNVSDADRASFKMLWKVFMIAYEGYTGFTISSWLCMYLHPETIPIFAYSLFGLYLYKFIVSWESKGGNDAMRNGKLGSIAFFFLPCYGGYCALHLTEFLQTKRA